jgi:hypothetical protein
MRVRCNSVDASQSLSLQSFAARIGNGIKRDSGCHSWIGEAGCPDPRMLVSELKYAPISLPKGQGKAGLIVADTAQDRTV